MRILQVIPYFTPKRGGDVKACENMASFLVARGHDVTIITTDFQLDENFQKIVQSKGITVVPFKCLANIGLFIISPSMKKWIKTNLNQFDIIHIHGFRSYQSNLIRRYSLSKGVPYILQAYGSVLPFFSKQLLKHLYDFVWGKKILRDAGFVIASTRLEAEQYEQMGVNRNRMKTIPIGIDASEFKNLPAMGRFRQQYGIPPERKIVLFLGRIHKIKGPDLLIEAFSLLIKKGKDAVLVIAGPDAGFQQVIEKRINELGLSSRVIIPGPLYQQSKIEAYVDADVYVLSSRYEAFGTTVLEASACGTRVIITVNSGIRDIVEKIEGKIVEFDKYELSNAIEEIIMGSYEYDQKRLRREYIMKEYDLNKIVERLELAYEDAMRVEN